MGTTVSPNSVDLGSLAHFPGFHLWEKRRHLLDTGNLTRPEVDCLMAAAAKFKLACQEKECPLSLLKSKTVANLFFENSTRTKSSFELAAIRLGASVLNLDIQLSSVAKGESVLDTAQTVVSMAVDAIVQRHSASGSAHQLARAIGNRVQIINAGDGWNAHPTQALLDAFTMLETGADLSRAKIAIIGDIMHSRVARSNLWLLKLLGMDIHFAGPPSLIPTKLDELGVTVHNKVEPAIEGCDFVMTLRLQLERQKQGLISSIGEYKKLYRLDHKRLRLAKDNVKVLHPGPVNRGIEITDQLASDQKYSLISQQVENGIAVRMAVLYLLLATKGVTK